MDTTGTVTAAPEIIESFPPGYNTRRYAWEDWADGQIRAFLRGVHFDTSCRLFRHAADNWARRKGFRIVSRVISEDEIQLQFVPERQRGRAPKGL